MPIGNQGWPHDFVSLAAGIIERKLQERGCDGDVQTTLSLRLIRDETIPGDGNLLRDGETTLEIAAKSKIGLLAGLGRLLRDGSIEGHTFCAGCRRGLEIPEKKLRGMYFATHFHNYYQQAPVEEIERLIEDLALWGGNLLCAWYDMHDFDSIDDPKSQAMLRRVKSLLAYASRLGMLTAAVGLANEAFASSPVGLRAQWKKQGAYRGELGGHYHVELCPSVPGGLEQILDYRRDMLRAFVEEEPKVALDYFFISPYDQGGCTCAQCAPWGVNGFLRTAKDVASLAKDWMPQTKIVLSTWRFDGFIDGEWDWLYRNLETERFAWVDTVMADLMDNPTIFRVKKENGAPGGKRLIGFPEISMHGAVPWGGFGANPMPMRLQRMWDETGALCDGGIPYSEGIYEDINKRILLSLYTGQHPDTVSALREYVRSEFSAGHEDEITDMLLKMEEGLIRHRVDAEGIIQDYPPAEYQWKAEPRYVIENTAYVDEVYAAARKIDEKLPLCIRAGWRWRLVYLRASIDFALLHNDFKVTKQSEPYFRELARLYCVPDDGSAGDLTPPSPMVGRSVQAWQKG